MVAAGSGRPDTKSGSVTGGPRRTGRVEELVEHRDVRAFDVDIVALILDEVVARLDPPADFRVINGNREAVGACGRESILHPVAEVDRRVVRRHVADRRCGDHRFGRARRRLVVAWGRATEQGGNQRWAPGADFLAEHVQVERTDERNRAGHRESWAASSGERSVGSNRPGVIATIAAR